MSSFHFRNSNIIWYVLRFRTTFRLALSKFAIPLAGKNITFEGDNVPQLVSEPFWKLEKESNPEAMFPDLLLSCTQEGICLWHTRTSMGCTCVLCMCVVLIYLFWKRRAHGTPEHISVHVWYVCVCVCVTVFRNTVSAFVDGASVSPRVLVRCKKVWHKQETCCACLFCLFSRNVFNLI